MITFIRKNKKTVLLTVLIVLNLCLAAWGDEMASSPAGDMKNTVVIKDFMFNPPVLTVKAGEQVTWINRDEEPHTVVSVGKQFQKSSALDTDDKFTITAAAPGTYTYFCSVHPKMTGTILVKK